MWQVSERGGDGERSERRVGVLASEASYGYTGGGAPASEASSPPEVSQVVAEGDGLRVDSYWKLLDFTPFRVSILFLNNFFLEKAFVLWPIIERSVIFLCWHSKYTSH